MGLWARIKQRWTTAHEHPPTPSLVMLLLKPHFLDAPMLARLATRALAQSMRADDIALRRVAEHWQVFVFDRGELRLAVHNAARRYIDLDQLQAARPRDPQVDQAIHDHQAWLSVDVLSDIPAEKALEAQQVLGKLAAALAMSDCLAVYAPALGQIRLYDEALRAQFESDEPMRAFVAR